MLFEDWRSAKGCVGKDSCFATGLLTYHITNSVATYIVSKPGPSHLIYTQESHLCLQVVDAQPKSRIWYRIGATRNITGGRRIQPGMKMSDKLKDVSVYYNHARIVSPVLCPLLAAMGERP